MISSMVAAAGVLLIAVLLGVIPLGVARPMPVGFLTRPELLSLVLIFFLSLPAARRVGSIFALKGSSRPERLLSLAWLVYMALYLTSCLLCQRLHVGQIHTRRPELGFVGDGLLIAALYIVYAKPLLVAYPRALALIIAMTGLSLAHLAWFPLTALPGMVVILAWQIGRTKRQADNLEIIATPEKDGFLVKPNEANVDQKSIASESVDPVENGLGSASSVSVVKSPRFKIIPFIY